MYVYRKIKPVQTTPGKGWGNKGEWWRGLTQVLYIQYIVRTL
jgi:hypothetical protein